MSQYYNPNRSSAWNYGGKQWKLSRSKIDLFLECPRCFYIDNKLGTKRPPGYPFNLNSAVDSLLKKEFDVHRMNGTQHPLMKAYGISAVPFIHEELDDWRENFKGVQYVHEESGMTITGAVDDIWINDEKELIIVDYKSTAKAGEITDLNEDWHEGYKRQMEVYQWLLRRKRFAVSNTGYFVYCNGDLEQEAFDGKLIFKVNLIPYEGNDNWVEDVIRKIKQCLEQDAIPEIVESCDYCQYIKTMKSYFIDDTLCQEQIALDLWKKNMTAKIVKGLPKVKISEK